MEIKHREMRPSVHPDAYVAPTAVLSGQVSVALGGAVHIGCVVPPETRIPTGRVAVGDPARLYPPGDVAPIRAGLEEAGGFLPFVFGADPAADRGEQMRTALRRYTRMLAREHRDDE
ncbi:MAG TPA: hypothetical protein VGD83_21160 [Streptosporangiaceae bacterium]